LSQERRPVTYADFRNACPGDAAFFWWYARA
jgi:hypothetical protein